MESFLYNIVAFIARIHTYILTLNDQSENSLTDKELHFIIVGALGIALILVLHPIFLWLAKTGHTLVVSFLYVLTVILVLTFAIEIGQGFTGTGIKEFDDVIYGVGGFLIFFVVFLVIRAIIHLIMRLARGGRRDDSQSDYF